MAASGGPPSSPPTVLIIGTLDTKLSEILYLRGQILATSADRVHTKILDVSRTAQAAAAYPAIPASELLTPLLDVADDLASRPRGGYADRAIEQSIPPVRERVAGGEIHGIVAAGGSTGSSIATAIMRRACPIGLPKLMVSTMASGDVKPYIEESDITIMYSVVDIAGMNSMLRQILANAAGAIVGMTSAFVRQQQEQRQQQQQQQQPQQPSGKRIAVSMFGVTTPCVDAIRDILTSTPHDVSGYEIYVFHATGSGGRAMERLIDEGRIDAVLDMTTTEIADELFGGILSAGPARLSAAAKRGIPTVVSVGACDMINFGPRESVPDRFAHGGRNVFVHNPAVTLVRTLAEENAKIGHHIADQLKTHALDPSQVRVILPMNGVSQIDESGGPFHDPNADAALFESVEAGLKDTEIAVFKYPHSINDEDFARAACEHLLELMRVDPRSYRLANARRRQWSFDHGASLHAVRRASLIDIPDAP